MKRFIQFVSLLLVLSVVIVTPVCAAENQTRESKYFGSTLAYLYATTGTQFQIWIEVDATSYMDKLGASTVTVQRSSNNSTWTDMATYTKEGNSQLVGSNTVTHAGYVTYTGTSGYYYRAKVTFYAKKGNGTAEYDYTTGSIRLS